MSLPPKFLLPTVTQIAVTAEMKRMKIPKQEYTAELKTPTQHLRLSAAPRPRMPGFRVKETHEHARQRITAGQDGTPTASSEGRVRALRLMASPNPDTSRPPVISSRKKAKSSSTVMGSASGNLAR